MTPNRRGDRRSRRSAHRREARTEFDALLAAARDGAAWAFTGLFERYGVVVLGFLRARGTPEAEEVVNDVFVAVFSQLDRFEGDEPGFRAWIFQIARHKRVDALRKLGRTADTIALDDPGGSDRRGNAEDEAIARLEDRELRAVLEQLTSDQRDVLLLRIIGDLSLEQTASALDKPVTAVKALQHRALAQLRKNLGPTPYPHDEL